MAESKYGYKIEFTEETCQSCGASNVSTLMKLELSTNTWTDTNIRMCHNCGNVYTKT